jgi:hypothetical protein
VRAIEKCLDMKTYKAVQSIYYPGFTYGGFAEGLGMLATRKAVTTGENSVTDGSTPMSSAPSLVRIQQGPLA